jgi:para-aminobenzoate synthetase component 1
MWSDRASPEQLRELVAALHSVVPAPSAGAASVTTAIDGNASVEQVAGLLRYEPGFATVNFTTQNGITGTHLLQKPLATLSYSDGCASVEGPGGIVRVLGYGFDILHAALQAWHGPSGALLVGFLAYELAAEIEDLGAVPPETFVFPQMHFALFDSALTFSDGGWSVTRTNAWREPADKAGEWIAQAENLVPPPAAASAPAALTSRPDRPAFENAVERIVQAIHAGDIFQTNLCRCIETRLDPGTEWELYRQMRSVNPARYEAFLRIGPRAAILSISPELFLKVDAGIVESSPIKGTRPRAPAAGEDLAFSAELLASDKDRAELAMIVDVVRNDLSRVCETGSVRVAGHAKLMSLPTVHHLYSTVTGRLRAEAGPVELLRAAFPAASITGAPKIQAIRVATQAEGQQRGPCMGAIGWIALDGRMEMSVAIRTAFVTDGRVRYYAGCGITADSIPHDEFVESSHKAAAFVRALGGESDSRG